MLSKLAETFYPVINLLPERAAMKVKVFLQIAFRDYTFLPPIFPLCKNFFDGVPEDIAGALPGIDAESLTEVKEFLHRIRMDLTLEASGISRDLLLVRRSFPENNLASSRVCDKKSY